MTEQKLESLPPPDTKRWVKSRKVAVIQAIETGFLTIQEACQRYGLSEEELHSWRHLLTTYGPEALRTTHLKRYRAQGQKDQEFQIVTDSSGTYA